MGTYLVTGGAGFIGSHVVEALAAEGHGVRVLDNLSTGRRANLAALGDRISLTVGDVRDGEAVARLCRGADGVLHLAALTSVPASVDDPLAYHDVDATGTLTCLEAARRAGVKRFVFSSTCAVYGDGGARPADETLAAQPASPYAAAKYAAETYCQAYARTFGMEAVVLRYFNVYGPRQRPDLPWAAVVPLFIGAYREGRAPVVFGTGEQTRDFIFVGDVARANVRAATGPAPPSAAYNIASGSSDSVLALLRAVAEAFRAEPRFRAEPARAGDILHSAADTSLAGRELGFSARTDLASGIRETADWFADRTETGASPPS